ncbi:MAG: hypothetical protein OEM41_04885 [Ignavibacteria bacterium]|nr:hypothetical protein [Ignavibacteria bacterium]
MKAFCLFSLVSFLFFLPSSSDGGGTSPIEGDWSIVPGASTDMATWRYRQLGLRLFTLEDHVVILHKWVERNRVAFVDSFACVPGKGETRIPITSEIWPQNWFMGVLAKPGTDRVISGRWKEKGKALSVVSEQVVKISQGERKLKTTWEYSVVGDTLVVREQRATRPTPVILKFVRAEEKKGT